MTREGPRPRGGGRVIRASIVVVLAVCAAAISVGLVPGAPVSLGTSPVGGGGPGAVHSLPTFAERTGYSTLPLGGISGAVPASGAQSVEITFEPRTPTFYDAPAPGTPPMTMGQIADTYGLSVPAYSAAEAYFESEGLTVSHAWPDRLSLSLMGSTAAVDRAFGTSLLSGSYDGRAVTFPGLLPSLPAGLESEVRAVSGLSTGFHRFSLPLIPAPIVTSGRPGPAQNPANLVTPSIARYIYGVSGLYNLTVSPTYSTGKGIVLLLWGAGYAPSDISTFFSQSYPTAFPAPQVVAYPVDGAPAPAASAVNDPSNGSREMTLDIEWSGSMAPGATLDAVYAPAGPASNGYSPSDTSMIDALNLAVDPSRVPGVATISMSFGSADGADPTLTTGFENDFAVAAHEGITLFAATGDLGGDAGAGCTGGAQPDYPSASPQVVAVGGTSVSLNYGALGGISGFSEAAWGMSGGGFSVQFPAPSWQEVGSAAAPISANGHRGMPDVAATAGYNYLYFNGGPAAGGGTSFATPLWAGMVTEMDALRGANFGFLTPALYGLGSNSSLAHPAFNDITSGRNCLGPAGPGWDTATGWGTPRAVNLFEHLVSSFVNISVAATPSPVTPGGTVTVVVTATNATSGRPLAAGILVVVTLASTGLGGPCAGTFGSATPLSNSTGNAVATFSVPVCFLGSKAIATAVIASGGYYGTNSTTVSVNLLGFLPALKPLAQFPNNILLFVLIMAVGTAVGGYLGRRREVTPIVPPVPVAPPPAGAPVLSPPPDPSSRPKPLDR